MIKKDLLHVFLTTSRGSRALNMNSYEEQWIKHLTLKKTCWIEISTAERLTKSSVGFIRASSYEYWVPRSCLTDSHFFLKNWRVHTRRQASPVSEILVFMTKISVTGLENFPWEHSSPVNGMKIFQICMHAFPTCIKVGYYKWGW